MREPYKTYSIMGAVTLIWFALLFITGLSAHHAQADFSQTDDSSFDEYHWHNTDTSDPYLWYGSLGDGEDVFTGSYDNDGITLTMKMLAPSTGNGSSDELEYSIQMFRCDDGESLDLQTDGTINANCEAVLSKEFFTIWLGSASRDPNVWYTFENEFTGTHTFVAEDDYYFALQNQIWSTSLTGNYWQLAGTDGFSSYPITKLDISGTNTEYTSNNLTSPYMIWSGTNSGPDQLPADTQILERVEPEVASFDNGYNVVTASTSVDFEVDYLSNIPVPDRICFEIDNLTTYQNLTPLCHTIVQSGSLTFATSTTLVESQQYRWRVVMWDDTNNILDITEWSNFAVVNAPQSVYDPDDSGFPIGSIPSGTTSTTTLSELSLECDPESNFFARSICNLAVLLFVPSQGSMQQLDNNLGILLSKLPFSVFQEFRQGWTQATRQPDVAYSSLTLQLYGQDVDVVSTTSLAAVAGENSLTNIRYLMAVGLWIAFAWFCFIRISRFF